MYVCMYIRVLIGRALCSFVMCACITTSSVAWTLHHAHQQKLTQFAHAGAYSIIIIIIIQWSLMVYALSMNLIYYYPYDFKYTHTYTHIHINLIDTHITTIILKNGQNPIILICWL